MEQKKYEKNGTKKYEKKNMGKNYGEKMKKCITKKGFRCFKTVVSGLFIPYKCCDD